MRKVLALLVALALPLAPALADEQARERDEEARTRVRALMAQVQEAANAKDRRALARLFDTGTMVEALEEAGFFKDMSPASRTLARAGLRLGFRMGLAQNELLDPFQGFEVRAVEPGTRAGRIVAYVRMTDDEGFVSKMRWYLVERPGALAIYDYEDLDVNLRLTAIMGLALGDVLDGGAKDWKKAAELFPRAQALMMEGALADARDLLDQLEQLRLPDALAAVVQMLLASVEVGDGSATDALEHIERAERLNPDMPMLDYLRARLLNDRGDHEAALAHAERYVKRLDTDAQADLELGRALLGLGHKPQALVALRRAWAGSPKDPEILAYLGMALPPEAMGELLQPFQGLHALEADFEQIAELCLAKGELDTLRAFTSLFESLRPEHPDGPYYRAQALWARSQPGQAAELFRVALERFDALGLDRELRWAYLSSYMETMAEASQAPQAYEALPDKVEAFRHMAPIVAGARDVEDLRRLLDLAAEVGELDRDRAFYGAEIELIEGRHAEAAERFRALHAALAPPGGGIPDLLDLVWQIEDRLVRALLRGGKLDEALSLGERIRERDDDFFYVLLARAHRGEVQAADEALGRVLDDGWSPADLLEDEDLGPILASPLFRALSARHGLGG